MSWLRFAANMGALISLIAWFYVHFEMKRRPIKPEDIIYQEWFRSGCRMTTLWSRLLGGGNNCIKFLFLKDRFIIRAHFPFSVIARVYGFDFEIPYDRIISASKGAFLSSRKIYLEFRGPEREEKVVFTASDPQKVINLLNELTVGLSGLQKSSS